MFCAMTTNTSAESALQNISAHPFSHNDYTLLAFNAALCLPNNQRHVELNDCFRLQMHGQSIQCMVFFTARGSNNNSMEPSRHLKTFCLGETVSDPQEATYPVPGSPISSHSYLSDPLRRHVRSTQWIHMIPLNLPKVSWIEVPECRVSPGWERFFRTARGSNNKSMEPSRHLKTFCLGENCFRPSWSDLSSARLINQVQTF